MFPGPFSQDVWGAQYGGWGRSSVSVSSSPPLPQFWPQSMMTLVHRCDYRDSSQGSPSCDDLPPYPQASLSSSSLFSSSLSSLGQCQCHPSTHAPLRPTWYFSNPMECKQQGTALWIFASEICQKPFFPMTPFPRWSFDKGVRGDGGTGGQNPTIGWNFQETDKNPTTDKQIKKNRKKQTKTLL